MKLIQINEENKVVDILNIREDATQDSIFVVNDIPTFIPKEGFNGVLMYNKETGLYWDYIEVPVIEEEISNEELGAMIKEVI